MLQMGNANAESDEGRKNAPAYLYAERVSCVTVLAERE